MELIIIVVAAVVFLCVFGLTKWFKQRSLDKALEWMEQNPCSYQSIEGHN
jgi:hypothetical protein